MDPSACPGARCEAPGSEAVQDAGDWASQENNNGMCIAYHAFSRQDDPLPVPIYEVHALDGTLKRLPLLKAAVGFIAMVFMFIYIVLFLVVLAVLYIKHRLTRMPVGRAWEALREDEIACRSMGLNHVLVKLSAFTIGASTAGLAGVFFASYQGFVNPSSFTFFESALILAIVVLGGMGSTVGVVIAAFVLTVAPELLRSFSEYRVLLFGVLMVVMMIWRPRGLIRISRTGVTPRKGVAP